MKVFNKVSIIILSLIFFSGLDNKLVRSQEDVSVYNIVPQFGDSTGVMEINAPLQKFFGNNNIKFKTDRNQIVYDRTKKTLSFQMQLADEEGSTFDVFLTLNDVKGRELIDFLISGKVFAARAGTRFNVKRILEDGTVTTLRNLPEDNNSDGLTLAAAYAKFTRVYKVRDKDGNILDVADGRVKVHVKDRMRIVTTPKNSDISQTEIVENGIIVAFDRFKKCPLRAASGDVTIPEGDEIEGSGKDLGN